MRREGDGRVGRLGRLAQLAGVDRAGQRLAGAAAALRTRTQPDRARLAAPVGYHANVDARSTACNSLSAEPLALLPLSSGCHRSAHRHDGTRMARQHMTVEFGLCLPFSFALLYRCLHFHEIFHRRLG
jgi:hypothetical protein